MSEYKYFKYEADNGDKYVARAKPGESKYEYRCYERSGPSFSFDDPNAWLNGHQLIAPCSVKALSSMVSTTEMTEGEVFLLNL